MFESLVQARIMIGLCKKGALGFCAMDIVYTGFISHHQDNFGSKQASHGVTNEDDICGRGLVWFEPGTKVVPRDLNSFVRFISGIYFGMHDVCFRQELCQKRVNLRRKRFERLGSAVEAMDVYDEQRAACIRFYGRRQQGLR